MAANRHDEKIVYKILNSATAIGASSVYAPPYYDQAILQVSVKGTSGIVSATVDIYGSVDPLTSTDVNKAAKILLATVSVSGTGTGVDTSADSDVWVIQAPYRYIWCDLTSISGTGAVVDVWLGV